MYSMPSSRRKGKNESKKLNLVPILDSVFILIFFLLLSASFLKIYEINSNVPIVSNQPPPPDKKNPLALTVEVSTKTITIRKGKKQSVAKTFSFNEAEDSFPYEELHSYMINLKKQYKKDRTVIFEPNQDVEYETIVKIMDAVRMLRKTDDAIYKKDKSGLDVKIEVLFDDIIFGNITS